MSDPKKPPMPWPINYVPTVVTKPAVHSRESRTEPSHTAKFIPIPVNEHARASREAEAREALLSGLRAVCEPLPVPQPPPPNYPPPPVYIRLAEVMFTNGWEWNARSKVQRDDMATTRNYYVNPIYYKSNPLPESGWWRTKSLAVSNVQWDEDEDDTVFQDWGAEGCVKLLSNNPHSLYKNPDWKQVPYIPSDKPLNEYNLPNIQDTECWVHQISKRTVIHDMVQTLPRNNITHMHKMVDDFMYLDRKAQSVAGQLLIWKDIVKASEVNRNIGNQLSPNENLIAEEAELLKYSSALADQFQYLTFNWENCYTWENCDTDAYVEELYDSKNYNMLTDDITGVMGALFVEALKCMRNNKISSRMFLTLRDLNRWMTAHNLRFNRPRPENGAAAPVSEADGPRPEHVHPRGSRSRGSQGVAHTKSFTLLRIQRLWIMKFGK